MQKGFTLIETLLYLALFAIVIGGGMIAAYQIIQATDANRNQVILQEEANFLLRKINWALTGDTSPPVSTANTLTVTKNINGTPTTLIFNYASPNLTLKRSGSPVVLNASSISITSLTFASTGTNGITTTFTLKTAQNGRVATQTFSTTKYLRQ